MYCEGTLLIVLFTLLFIYYFIIYLFYLFVFIYLPVIFILTPLNDGKEQEEGEVRLQITLLETMYV